MGNNCLLMILIIMIQCQFYIIFNNKEFGGNIVYYDVLPLNVNTGGNQLVVLLYDIDKYFIDGCIYYYYYDWYL